jgi:hypothetical protein
MEHINTQPIESLPEKRPGFYVKRMKLPESGEIEIDTSQQLIPPEGIYQEKGINAALIGGIRAGEGTYLLLDTRTSAHYETPFLITTEDFRQGDSKGFVALRATTPLTIGRQAYSGQFAHDSRLSRSHFSLTYDEASGTLMLHDNGSRNGTFFTGYTPDAIGLSRLGIDGSITADYAEEARHGGGYRQPDASAPYGREGEYPIIGRLSMSVRDGVYGTRTSELIHVDAESLLMRIATRNFVDTLPNDPITETLSTVDLLRRVNDYVAGLLRYDVPMTDHMSEPYCNDHQLINLSVFIEARVGVCRHHALMAAHLVEELIDRGMVSGSVGVERNQDYQADGAHAWAIYRDDNSHEVIVDPTYGFVGSRTQAAREGGWRYIVAADVE